MKIIDLVNRINRKMNNYNLSYDELWPVLDEAIDELNTLWHIEVPMISDLPEMDGNGKPVEYNNVPDEILRMFVVPYAAGRQFAIYELDGSAELNQSAVNLGKLSERWGHVAHIPGPIPFTSITKNLGLVTENFTDTVFEVPGIELENPNDPTDPF